jgi:hypothetical protein
VTYTVAGDGIGDAEVLGSTSSNKEYVIGFLTCSHFQCPYYLY